MPNRYEDVPQDVLYLAAYVQKEWFPYLINAKVKVLFDTKKRASKGRFVLGRIQKTSTVLRHLTREEARSADGFDYILYLDKAVFESVEKADRIRIIRHEFRHCFYDLDSKNDPYKLVGHDIEDFYEEMELNKDDLRWRERIATVAASIYDTD